jgi:hypothetical protein
MTSTARPLRVCDVCGQVDDHPRHVFVGSPDEYPVNDEMAEAILAMDLSPEDKNRIYKEVQDTTVQQRHMDCCRDAGCPDGSCQQVTKGAEKLKGSKLVAHLTKEK